MGEHGVGMKILTYARHPAWEGFAARSTLRGALARLDEEFFKSYDR